MLDQCPLLRLTCFASSLISPGAVCPDTARGVTALIDSTVEWQRSVLLKYLGLNTSGEVGNVRKYPPASYWDMAGRSNLLVYALITQLPPHETNTRKACQTGLHIK